jgi:protein O-GlcNAc transferase
MPTIPEALNIAVQHHQAGRLREAEQIYRQILQAQPNHADAWHLLGLVAHQTGQSDLAIDYLNQAIQYEANIADFHTNLGTVFFDLKRFSEGAICFNRAIEIDPRQAGALYKLGNTYKSMLRLVDAEACYRQALQLEPAFSEAHNNLGSILRYQNRISDADFHFKSAITLDPNFALAHFNLGVSEYLQGKLVSAEFSLQRAICLQPDNAEAHFALGKVFQQEDKLSDSIHSYRKAIQLNPNHIEAHTHLGIAFQLFGDLDMAEIHYQKSLELQPRNAVVQNNVGNILKARGLLLEALSHYQRAIEIKPDFAEAHNNIGNVLKDRGEQQHAIYAYQRAIALKPDYAEAFSNLGNAFKSLWQHDAAIRSYFQAIHLKPDYAEAHNNLGNALREMGKLPEAIAAYHRATELNPSFAQAFNNLGITFKEQGNISEAINSFCKAIALKPDYLSAYCMMVHELQHQCAWESLNKHTERLLTLWNKYDVHDDSASASPFSFLVTTIPTTSQQQLQCAQIWVKKQLAISPSEQIKSVRSQKLRNPHKIKIAYASSDFHAHATAWLIAELFEHHTRDRFEVYAYSYGSNKHDEMRERLKVAVDQFKDIQHLSFPESAKLIANDEVRILIDLKGYTQHARTEILAYRPAPIQVNYLGYPGTMGADFIDYILVDDFIVPSEQQPFFTEKLVHLPDCYQVNDSQRAIAERTPTRAECGLPENGFVFCSFNNNYKITPNMFDVWMELLVEIPESVLWLYAGNASAPDRLVFAPRAPLPEHLARHRLADLFLDTYPVNAHTTASDALWAGCPLITIAGETFVSRVAGSLLRAMGLPELITTSFAQYKSQALQLARNPTMLAEIRQRLAANRLTSTLFNAEHFARKIEAAFTQMWEIHCAGESPRSFRVTEEMLRCR